MKEVETHQLEPGWKSCILRTDDNKEVACCGPSSAKPGKWFVVAWKPDSRDGIAHVRSYTDSEEEAKQMMYVLAVQTRLDHA